MLLFVTKAEQGAACAAVLQGALQEEVLRCSSFAEAHRRLRRQAASCVVVDQALLEVEEERALHGIATTTPLAVVNLAISAPPRIVTQVQAGLKRVAREREAVRREVAGEFRSELNSTVTGILLASQLALNDPGLPEPAAEKLRSVFKLARDLRARLQA